MRSATEMRARMPRRGDLGRAPFTKRLSAFQITCPRGRPQVHGFLPAVFRSGAFKNRVIVGRFLAAESAGVSVRQGECSVGAVVREQALG